MNTRYTIEQNIERIADALTGLSNHFGNQPALPIEVATGQPKISPEHAIEVETAKETAPENLSVSLEDMRAALICLSKTLDDNNESARAILQTYGGNKVSDIPADKYTNVVHACEVKIAEATQ